MSVEIDCGGRVAIVTGAGSKAEGVGNGRAAAVLLARAGARVAIVDSNEEALSATSAMIREEGGSALEIVADVADPESCRTCVDRVVGEYGKVDILVNNVGIEGPKGNALEVDLDEWSTTMDINVRSMVVMARYCIPSMREAGGGAIVNLSSVSGLQGGSKSLCYATSKGAISNLTRAMAVQHGGVGVRVNAVAPGLVHTPRSASRKTTESQREARRQAAPLGTEGTAWDVANAVVWLSSDLARWITGVVLPVDAGLSVTLALPGAGTRAAS